MNWSAVSVTVPPTAYPVSLEEAKSACRVMHSDQDAEISGLMASAVHEFDGPDALGLALMEQTWRLRLDAFPASTSFCRVGQSNPLWP